MNTGRRQWAICNITEEHNTPTFSHNSKNPQKKEFAHNPQGPPLTLWISKDCASLLHTPPCVHLSEFVLTLSKILSKKKSFEKESKKRETQTRDGSNN